MSRTCRVLTVVGVLLALTGALQATVVREADLAGWWKMGEGATWDGTNWTVPDASVNSNAGTSVNMDNADQVAGNPFTPYPETSLAMDFNVGTSNEYVNLGTPAALNITGSLTISAWVKLPASPAGGLHSILGKGDHQYMLRVSGSQPQFFTHGTGWSQVNANATISTDQWHLLAGMYDSSVPGGEVSIWVDGVKQNQTKTGAISEASHAVHIGNNSEKGTDRTFHGAIDDARIYSAALSADEMAEMYSKGLGDFQIIPEPMTMLAVGLSVAGLGGYIRKRRRA